MTPARSAEIAGVNLVEKASVAGRTSCLSGAGVRTRAFFKVYAAGLYLPQKATSADAALAQKPRRIELVLLRNVSADQFVDALNEGLRDNSSPAELSAIEAQIDQLTVDDPRLQGGAGEGCRDARLRRWRHADRFQGRESRHASPARRSIAR